MYLICVYLIGMHFMGVHCEGFARSLFNYLVPMLQDKQAEEEETEGEALGLST